MIIIYIVKRKSFIQMKYSIEEKYVYSNYFK